jgi:ComF family protein
MTLSLARIGHAAIDLLYPPRCALCDRGGDFLCTRCVEGLPAADGARCNTCWMPLRHGVCHACVEHPRTLDRVRAAFRYERDVRRLVQAFKFGGQSCLAPSLAAPMLASWSHHRLEADLIVPVPLTGRRRRERGFNQAALLGRELSRAVGLPVSEALSRRSSPRHQAESASAEERWRNVEGAFVVSRPDSIRGRRLLLIDDITTTGATLDACARALREAGAAQVCGLTLARED